MQLSPSPILRTPLTRTLCQRGKALRGDFLEDFVTACVACVGVDEQKRLDFGDSGDDAADGDEFTEMVATDGSDREGCLVSGRSEVKVAAQRLDAR